MSKETFPDILKNLLKDPDQITEVLNNPGKFGMELYDSLTTRQKQYIIFAAAAGLVVYGFSLGGNSSEEEAV
ncbi:hypothetical protein MKJ04_01010 [Pontibacter sp. E15-1]|uniref:hypothetical protein n=1 Tax=Pontibacter sp. E15-1 TaxID=2919918 RepID=UPI001F4F7F33|nr:hypothetical protein [Pontibacter sp. E15-1]MCJ8163402.1 hypothetical protein [Pontibacter sp. E15-1]